MEIAAHLQAISPQTQPMHPIPHKSVLTSEVLHYLDPQPDKTYIDVTFGCGGHTRAILAHEPRCKIIALDWDKKSLEKYALPLQAEFGDRLKIIWGNFGNLYKLLKKAGITQVDGIIADFGTSQEQIHQRDGFSFRNDTPLDMRMSPPHTYFKAADVINKFPQQKLQKLFFELGEERYAKKIAHAIVIQRKKQPIATTGKLARLIEAIVPKRPPTKRSLHPATRVFQALRIFVNKELINIKKLLESAQALLKPEGRLVCISFHSLEDRLVKQFLHDNSNEITSITKKPITASEEEITRNRSCRSAKLRAATKTSSFPYY